MMVARVDGVVAYACLVHVILPPRQPYSFIMMRGRGMLSRRTCNGPNIDKAAPNAPIIGTLCDLVAAG